MKREIYIVTACVVDANGTFSNLSGYPKTYDSKNYGGDADKTLMRARSDYHDVVSAMCKADTRQLQVASVTHLSDGASYDAFYWGELAELPDPE
jgi:hypothetical protein